MPREQADSELTQAWADFVLNSSMLFQSTNEAINELNTTQKSAVLHAEVSNPAWQTIPRHGDVLLGLHLYAAATRTLVVRMVIGGMTVGRFRIEPGTKVLAFLGVSYVNLLALQYHNVSYYYDYDPDINSEQ